MKIAIVGSGVSGLAAASILAKKGHEVHVYEKNNQLGGRLSTLVVDDAYVFDMGPSWYWMPEIFEQFYNYFGKSTVDFYELRRLDPSYQVYFQEEVIGVPATLSEIFYLFESREQGSGKKLYNFLKKARFKYQKSMGVFVWKLGDSVCEYLHIDILVSIFKMGMLQSISSVVSRVTKDDRLQKILEFPSLFLGARPSKTPAMYTIMNYADLVKGTWYPMGGMGKIVDAFVSIGLEQGVHYHCNSEVSEIVMENDKITGIVLEDGMQVGHVDALVAACDYEYFEQTLLPESHRQYSTEYWSRKTMSPSSLLFYIGLDIMIEELEHHNLFFDSDFEAHLRAIYNQKSWPENPLFYVCNPSKTDPTLAPKGHSVLFILIPLAAGLQDNDDQRETQFAKIIERLKNKVNIDITPHIQYKSSFAMRDFKEVYHSFKGNAYGLANTLKQTAFLKPRMENPFVKNLVFTGQLTNPGPGLPPSIISGQLAAITILRQINSTR